MLSKTQIDRLGDRLRRAITDSDLELLNEYRSSFLPPYSELIGTIRAETGIEPSGRVPKSVPSIVAKLRRESVRLSQIQDIAGVRVVAGDIGEQAGVVASFSS